MGLIRGQIAVFNFELKFPSARAQSRLTAVVIVLSVSLDYNQLLKVTLQPSSNYKSSRKNVKPDVSKKSQETREIISHTAERNSLSVCTFSHFLWFWPHGVTFLIWLVKSPMTTSALIFARSFEVPSF